MKKLTFPKKALLTISLSWRASPRTFLALIASSLLLFLAQFFEIVITQHFFDQIANIATNSGDRSLVIFYMILFCVLFLAFPLVELFEYLSQGYFYRRSNGYIQAVFHSKVGKKDLVEFDKVETFDTLEKAKLGTANAPTACRTSIQCIFYYFPLFIMTAFYLFSVLPEMVIILVILYLSTLIIKRYKASKYYSFENNTAPLRRKMDYLVKCIISREYFKETRTLGAFPRLFAILKDSVAKYGQEKNRVEKKILGREAVMRLINCLTYAGILVLLAYHLMHYNITIGTFVAVYYSIEKLNVALANMFRDIGETMQDIETTSFLYDYLAEEDVKRRFDEYSDGQTIELRNVSFRYENTAYNAVNDINLIIRAGETVAIVGENGAGKSTLTKLIVGLYLPRSGVVLHGNRPTSSFALQALFKRQSAVFQDFVKYKMSLKENIRISDMSSKKAVDEVVSLTNIHINNLPNGMDTVLAREFGGTDVSGGEWQRIAIARGLYKESNIIILDEPTASIDPLEETRIFELFQNATIGKTTILVTHRIGSAKLANKIIVMENGNIIEVGKHEELLQKRGLYYKLYQEQYQWYQR